MRALIQRVRSASVMINGTEAAAIEVGLLVFLGVESIDTLEDVEWLASKVARMRLFADHEGAMNLSVIDRGGQALVVSQFTLCASTKKGQRPSFIRAARPEQAIPLYEAYVKKLAEEIARPVPTGTFGADMQVSLVNDGPVTIWIDSRQRE